MNRLLALGALLLAPLVSSGQAAMDVMLTAPDGNTVSISRDDYGVPHIFAPTEPAVFFGQGFAVAQDRLFQMETFWRSATGRLAEIQGPSALAQDQNIRTVYYTPAERATQFAALTAPVRTMMEAYVAGINTYIDSTVANRAYLPAEYQLGGFAPERWNQDKLVAVLQFFMRRFGEIGGDELTRMAELSAQGPAWFAANRPVNDPTAPTTIDGGTPPTVAPWTPRTMADYPSGLAQFAADASAHVREQRAATDAFLSGLGVPMKLGSFASTISPAKAEAGYAMLLGAPQMGAPSATSKAVTSEVELIVFSPNGLHIAGMTVPGIPGVIIGRTADFAWTLTTGFTDNTDTYIETLNPQGGGYIYDGQSRPFDLFQETIFVAGAPTPVTFTHSRSVHGPVYFSGSGFVASWKYAFWNMELDMVEAFYDVWRSTSLDDFKAAAERVTMSFNLFYADRQQNTAFFHVGRYPVRPATTDPRLPLDGGGTEEWTGILPFSQHPSEINPTKGYFANWNNKPAFWWNQGDNTPWTSTTPGSRRVYNGVSFLADHLVNAGNVSFDELQELTRVVRSNPLYQEYPGTYQQVVEFGWGYSGRSENVVPPGQSGFVAVVNGAPVPSPHFADQWAFYQSSIGTGDVIMKPFLFDRLGTAAEDDPQGVVIDLDSPAPNPVAGNATLRYQIDALARVRLAVYDALGREVALLVDEEQSAGPHRVSLASSGLAAGVYLVRLQAAGAATTRRIVVAR